MFKGLWFLFLLFILMPGRLKAQVLPKEGSSLNYRIIGFSFPASKLPKGNSWKIEIAGDNYTDTATFRQNIIHVTYLHSNRVIIEVPAFGRQYTWRVVYTDDPTVEQLNTFHHFSTAIVPNVDTSLMQLSVLKRTYKYKDCLVFLDGSRVLYNMKGEPIWFLPKIDSFDNTDIPVRDLKISSGSTITFIGSRGDIYEIDYNSKILWRGPLNNKPHENDNNNGGYYHHDFSKLANGNYMVLGKEWIPKDWNNNIAGNLAQADINDKTNKLEFGTVEEYDKYGNRVWYWKSSTYYKSKWNYYQDMSNTRDADVHENAFFFNEKKQIVYVSFKNTNQIIAVKYPKGQVINIYGKLAPGDTEAIENNLFCQQHSCHISREGYIYLFNNNTCKDRASSVVVMEEPAGNKGNLKKVWEYVYTSKVENQDPLTVKKTNSIGGNVIELPDASFFVSLCGAPASNMFIVNKAKKIMWDAIFKKKMPNGNTWIVIPQYRASIIKNHKELEELIWHSES